MKPSETSCGWTFDLLLGPLYLFLKHSIFKASQNLKSKHKFQAKEFKVYFSNKRVSQNHFTRCVHYSLSFLFVIKICSFFFFCPYPFILWFVISLFRKVLITHIVNLSLFVQAPYVGRSWTLWSPVGFSICIANDWWWQNVMSYWFSFSNCEVFMKEVWGKIFQLKRKKKNLKIVRQCCSYHLIIESPNLGRDDKHC